MKLFSLSILSLVIVLGTSCSSKVGTQVKEPFSGKSYTSNAKYFRAVGKGVSSKDNIASSKADVEAHKELAQQLVTTIQVVSDAYSQDVQGAHVNEAIERFESLAREVTNTTIADLRKVGEKKFILDDGNYSVYVAYEIKKSAMFRLLKKIAKAEQNISPLVRTQIVNMCDEEIEKLEE